MAPEDRRLFRERALSLIYEAEMKGLTSSALLEQLPVREEEFVVDLLKLEEANRETGDRLIDAAARGWDLDRMPVIDLCILRLATCELLSNSETPHAVIISEAVELAKRFSTDSSSKFVNGILATIKRGAEAEVPQNRSGEA